MKTTTTKKKAAAPAAPLEASIYSAKGTATGTVALPEAVFGLPWNGDLVHQVAVAMQANARPTVANAKTRAEVSGGGKKPWRQKGTGRARHGSSRSPIWRSGGATHGPLAEKDYSQKINKKMRTKALFTALSEKVRKNQVLFVDSLALGAIKTKDAMGAITALAAIPGFEKLTQKRGNAAVIALPGRDAVAEKSLANIPQVSAGQVKDLNVLDVLNNRYVVVVAPAESIAFLEGKTK